MLSGGAICTLTYLRDGAGPCQAFSPALGVPRIIWFGLGFLAQHAMLAQDVVSRTGHRICVL